MNTRTLGARVLAAVAAILAATATAAMASEAMPRTAPSLTLPDRHGAIVPLDSLKGRVVLVDVWASWCPPCKAAFPAYDDLYREYRDRGLEVLAINVDETRAAADAFLQGREFQVKVLLDPKGLAPTAFKLQAMPTSYLIDRRGMTRFSHEGFTDRTVAQYRREIEQLLAETSK